MKIIETNEAIDNPVSFFAQDPDLLNGVDRWHDPTVVCAPNVDVMAQLTSRTDVQTPESPISDFFGKAYQRYRGVVSAGDKLIELVWYKSPNAVNQLMEDIGMTPGSDSLRFTHSPLAHIPAKEYVKHLAKAEFPVSSHPEYFTHDRSVHSTGVMLLPPHVTKEVVKAASRPSWELLCSYLDFFVRSRAIRMPHIRGGRLVRDFDVITEAINQVASLVVKEGPQPKDFKHRAQLLRFYLQDSLPSYRSELWGEAQETSMFRLITGAIIDRMAELEPKVAPLRGADVVPTDVLQETA